MSDTRERLLSATLEVLREHGIARVSARSIATTADANQALVFYHFGSVDQLVDAACREGAEQRVETYRARFAEAQSLHDLVALARAMHTEETARGDVTVLAQVLAGARHDPRLAPSARHALGLWVGEVRPVLERLLDGHPLAGVVDVARLSRTVAAAFVGVELYAGVDPAVADDALGALDDLATAYDAVGSLPAPARSAVRAAVRRVRRTGSA